jgi:hypothetical protein
MILSTPACTLSLILFQSALPRTNAFSTLQKVNTFNVPSRHISPYSFSIPSSSSDYLDGMETNWESNSNETATNFEPSPYLENLKTEWNDDEVENDEQKEVKDTNDELDDETNDYNIKDSDILNILQSILITASSSDRGQFLTTDKKQKMEELIMKLESSSSAFSSSIPNPTTSPSIQGTWELLYSSTQLFRSSPFFMAGRAVCQTEEEAQRYDWFCDMHRAALAISEIGTVRQIITDDRLISEFEVHVGAVPFLSDVLPFVKYSGGLPFTITGAIVSSADITGVEDGKGWEIFMDTVEIKGSNIPLLRRILDEGLKLQSRGLGKFLESNIPSYSNPKPIFRTTFLTEDIRISRDQDGKVFVYGKVSDSTDATDYKGVDADLGLLNLLEGLNDNFMKFSI